MIHAGVAVETGPEVIREMMRCREWNPFMNTGHADDHLPGDAVVM